MPKGQAKAFPGEITKRMKSESKPYITYISRPNFKPAWTALYEKAIQEDATYQELAIS